MKTFISVAEAREIVLQCARVQPSTVYPLEASRSMTLAEDVTSRETIPPFDNSAMDGFAVRSEDTAHVPIVLSVAESITAGTMPERPLHPGLCSRIMTGAPIPEGADAVVPVEWTSPVDGYPDRILINRSPAAGEHVRKAGEDIVPGARIVAAGTVVTPPVIGIMATLGVAEVAVRKPPSVAVVATGDELVKVSDTPAPGQIRNSNGPAVAAQVESAGGIPLVPEPARDTIEALKIAFGEALEADVIVISGGVSMGSHDMVTDVLTAMGMKLIFWKIRQRPGKPMAFGLLDDKMIFGLPGNPVSSAVCFEQYVRPAIARMLGRTRVSPPLLTAKLDAPVTKKAGLHFFSRGLAFHDDQGSLTAKALEKQGSNLYTSMVEANCLIHLPEELEDPVAGTRVKIEWLEW